MSEIVRLSVALTLRSPFMFQGLANAMLGIDAANLRGESGRPVIPADQIKGVLRAACEVLKDHKLDIAPEALLNRLFGAESPKHKENDFESYDRPHRGLLIAGDLAAGLPEKSELTTTRIEIDDETGAVKSGALQVVELVAPFGKEVAFKGEFVLLAEKGVEPEQVESLLSRALALVPAIGAFKSAGFGEIVASEVKIVDRK
ncbi:MAG: RAMP superfamily CRISPR-associated protein, partial [Methylocella sp.]